MPYVALKPIYVGMRELKDKEGNLLVDEETSHPLTESVIRQPGEIVPEAETWKDANAYVAQGKLQFIPQEQIDLAHRVEQLEASVAELRGHMHTHDRSKNEKEKK